MAEAEEFVKPKPKLTFMPVAELQQKLKANEKYAVATKPIEEGVKFLTETYRCDEDSARKFVDYLQGRAEPGGPAEPKIASERLRKGCDPETGREVFLDPDEKPTK